MSNNIIKLAIGLPAYGGKIQAEAAKMYIELGASLADARDRFQLAGVFNIDTQPIDRARNLLVALAMSNGADWLLMIDADTWVVEQRDPNVDTNPDLLDSGFQLLRMISQAERAGSAVVGAPVHLRDGRGLNIKGVPLEKTQRNDAFWQGNDDRKAPVELRSCDSIGAAVLAINLHKIGEVTFKFTDALSEDLNFCKDVREIGGRIFVDGRVKTAHMMRQEPLYSR